MVLEGSSQTTGSEVPAEWMEVAAKAKWEAMEWLRNNYFEATPEEAWKNMVDYIFKGDEKLAMEISALELEMGKDFDDEVAHMIHEMVEATEIKKRHPELFEQAKRVSGIEWARLVAEPRASAHPIATQYEIKFLKDIGRTDLLEQVKMREVPRRRGIAG
jgi:hypothetical protein